MVEDVFVCQHDDSASSLRCWINRLASITLFSPYRLLYSVLKLFLVYLQR